MPLRVVDIVPFAYELDLLEIRLMELKDEVDLFVVFESTFTQRMARKPLVLARQLEERFAQWRDRILYFVMDDSVLWRDYGTGATLETQDWRNEATMRWFPWEMLTQALGPAAVNDSRTLYLHEDMDQIPSAEAVAHLKRCRWRAAVEAGGDPELLVTPVAMPGIHWATNFAWIRRDVEPAMEAAPRTGYYWWTSMAFAGADAIIKKDGHTWMPFRTGAAWKLNVPAWAGAHLSAGLPAAAAMMKDLGMAEGGEVPRAENASLARLIAENPSSADIFRVCGVRPCCWDDATSEVRTRAADGLRRGASQAWIPWFAEANPARYPYLFPSPEAQLHCDELVCQGEGGACRPEDKVRQESFALRALRHSAGGNGGPPWRVPA